MIGAFVRFQFNEDFNEARLRTLALNAAEKFQGMPGLRSKAFTLDAKNRRAENFYIWDDEQTAKDFFSEERLQQISSLYGVLPTVDLVEIAELVDNFNTEEDDEVPSII